MKQGGFKTGFSYLSYSRMFTIICLTSILFIAATFTGYIVALKQPAVSMLIVATVMLVGIFWVKTKLGLICILLVRPIFDILWSRKILSISFLNLNLLQTLGGLVTVLCFAYLFLRHKNIARTPILKSILIFLGICILSAAFFSPNLFFEITVWFKFASSFAIGLLIVEIFDNCEKIRKLLSALLFACVVVVVISLSDFFMGGHAYYARLYSTFGPYAGPHSLCYFLLMIQPIILLKISTEDKAYRRLMYWLLVSLIGFIIFNTFVRNGWIGFAIQIILYSVFKRNWKLLIAFLILAIMSVFMNYEVITKRFSDVTLLTAGPSGSAGALSGRIGIWHAYINSFINSSLLTKLIGKGVYTSVAEILHMPHNDYLFLLCGVGIIGLVSLLYILVQLYKALILLIKAKANPFLHNIGVTGFILLISYLIMISNVNLIIAPNSQWYFWCFMGIVISLARIYRKRIGNE